MKKIMMLVIISYALVGLSQTLQIDFSQNPAAVSVIRSIESSKKLECQQIESRNTISELGIYKATFSCRVPRNQTGRSQIQVLEITFSGNVAVIEGRNYAADLLDISFASIQ